MSNQIELRHLRYFLAVAEELHFRKAAERLYISQPGLSRQVRQLEEHLDVKLFERNNKKVALTKAGDYLLQEVQATLKHLEHAFAFAKLLNEGIEGELKFGYLGSAMQNVIPDLLVQFRAVYPNIIFDLKEMDNQKQIENLLTQEIDIGFVRLEEVPVDLQLHPLLEDSFSLVLPKDHRLNKRNFQKLSQVKDEPFILFDPSYSPTYYKKIMEIFDFAGFRPIASHNTVHANSIYSLVEKHFGISIVPTSLQSDVSANKAVKFIELKKIPQRTLLSAVWNKRNRNPIFWKLVEVVF